MKLHHLTALLIIAATTLLTSCGGSDTFTVQTTVEGLGTQNVRIIYRDGDRQRSLTATALDGKFNFTGSSDTPVLIDLYTGSRSLMGNIVARNGDNIELKLKLNQPSFMTAKGNTVTEQLARFRADNADIIDSHDTDAINNAIATYVTRHPDDPASGYLLLTLYNPTLDPLMADSLMQTLTPRARPSGALTASYTETLTAPADTITSLPTLTLYTLGDSTTTVTTPGPGNLLIALTGHDTPGAPRDTVTSWLNSLSKRHSARTRIVELSLLPDTATWHSQVNGLKPRYTYTWVPGGPASPAIEPIRPSILPWFIVADTTGTVLYTGPLYSDAIKHLP